jgi:hypothetical protein
MKINEKNAGLYEASKQLISAIECDDSYGITLSYQELEQEWNCMMRVGGSDYRESEHKSIGALIGKKDGDFYFPWDNGTMFFRDGKPVAYHAMIHRYDGYEEERLGAFCKRYRLSHTKLPHSGSALVAFEQRKGALPVGNDSCKGDSPA